MKVVVLGGTGLAGQALLMRASFRDHSALSVARRDADIILDLTDLIEVERFLETERPDCIINAALANVGECQKNTVESWIINTAVVGVLRHWSFEKISVLSIIFPRTIFSLKVAPNSILKTTLFD